MDFSRIHADELNRLRAARAGTATGEAMIGLALSGGGIRSATFNLGILQGLARRGLLKHIDYLSTVSGGGYIGSWYMAFLKRVADGKPGVAEDLLNPDNTLGPTVEPASVVWLRRFSNYLTPKTGLSGDTLTLISTYVRNFLLNLTILLSFFAALLLLPRLLTLAQPTLAQASLLPQAIGLPLLIAMLSTIYLVVTIKPAQTDRDGFPHDQLGVVLLVVAPILFAAIALSLGLASPGFGAWAGTQSDKLSAVLLALGVRPEWLSKLALHVPHWQTWTAAQLIASVAYLLPWALGSLWILSRRCFIDLQRPLRQRDLASRLPQSLQHALVMFLSAVVASLLAGGLVGALAEIAARFKPFAHEVIVFGPPLVFLAFIVPVGLHIGLARRHFTEMQREWWSRLGGWIIASALVWLVFTGIALYGPYLMMQLNHWLLAGGGLAWLGTTGWALLAAKSGKTGAPNARGAKEYLLRLAPWGFVLGLLGLVSLGLHFGLSTEVGAIIESARVQIAFDLAGVPMPKAGAAAVVCGIVFLLLGWRIDINLFSLHNFYRNRLTRGYLGASRACRPENEDRDCRKPNPFTGFDPGDDMALTALPHRPYALFNTALNLVGGQELAWQQRKAASFTFSPMFCGYELPAGMGCGRGAYRATDCFLAGELKGEYRDEPPDQRGVRLGTAIAISGAAVCPNMGFHSSPAVAFLLTVFNLRLGRWVGNPDMSEKIWRKTSPCFGVRYLLLELFGLTSQRRDWLNLSDGGHFENLGIYELVRRGLPYIVAVDAAEDADFHFDDLANAIRKIRADFGIDIDIDLTGLRPRQGDGYQPAHATIGHIRYDQIDPLKRPGMLVYLRPGLTGNEPADILSYARKSPPFPFQSTLDQFFDEAQFESYRRLGLHIADSILREAAERHSTQTGAFNPEAFFTVLREAWRGRLKIDDGVNAMHHERLDALFERLRTDPELAFLSAEFFPEWPALMQQEAQVMALPAYEGQRRSGFYLCREIAQLMERVYQDLDLENQYDHPDCRGWMNLFRHWSWSPMFRATYAITAATLSERFQRFCKRRLDLDMGQIELIGASLGEASLAELNFVERGLIERGVSEKSVMERARIKLIRFELAIRYPAENESHIELLRFHFGFALLDGNRLIGLRIQDHLRRMGLARKAMMPLLAESPGLGLDFDSFQPTRKSDATHAIHQAALRHLFESVRAILAARSKPTMAQDRRMG